MKLQKIMFSIFNFSATSEIKEVFISSITDLPFTSSESVTKITGYSKHKVEQVLHYNLLHWLEEIAIERYNISIKPVLTKRTIILNQFEYSEFLNFIILQHFQSRDVLIINKLILIKKLKMFYKETDALELISMRSLLENVGIYDDNVFIYGEPILQSNLKDWIKDLVLSEYNKLIDPSILVSKIQFSDGTCMVFYVKINDFEKIIISKIKLHLIQDDGWLFSLEKLIFGLINERLEREYTAGTSLSISDYYQITDMLLEELKITMEKRYSYRILHDQANDIHYLIILDRLESLVNKIRNLYFKGEKIENVVDFIESYPQYSSAVQRYLQNYFDEHNMALLDSGKLLFQNQEKMKKSDPTRNITAEPLDQLSDQFKGLSNEFEQDHPLLEDIIDPKSSDYPVRELKTPILKPIVTLSSKNQSPHIAVAAANRPKTGKDEDRYTLVQSKDGVIRGMVICDGISNSGSADNGDKIGGEEAAEICTQIFKEEFLNVDAHYIYANFEIIVKESIKKIQHILSERNSISKTTFILLLTDGYHSFISYLGDGTIIQLRSDGVSASAHLLFAHKATSRALSGFIAKEELQKEPVIQVLNNPFLDEGIFFVIATDGMGFPAGPIAKDFTPQVMLRFIRENRSKKKKLQLFSDVEMQVILDEFLASIDNSFISDDITLGIVSVGLIQ
ncbi:MAG: hypothetical protein INQ03_20490 [Candidatus Heimdallarchaeota archaeon]|nr:hypothetical protein [Candidatus Heimdallarchaeota archaeon]